MRRATELAAHYTTVLDAAGRPTTEVPLATAITSTAELMAIAEDMRTRMLRAEVGVNADDVVRMQRLADMSVRRLGLPNGPAKTTPTLADILGDSST